MTMAYIDFAEPISAPSAPLFFGTAAPAEPVTIAFSVLERTIIRLAREDGLSSLREESEFKEFLRLVFGFERKRPLSSPRLEALRRIAVLSWNRSYNIPTHEISAFLDAGYSPDHYDAVLAHIGAERAASAKRTRK